MGNIYLPNLATIEDIRRETPEIVTLKIVFAENELRERFSYIPGQFIELSVFGEGEAPFCIASSPTARGFIECSVKKMGKVTQAIHELEIGDTVGVRGPYGNGFPIEAMKGKDLLFIAGGIGMAPLRSLINYTLDAGNREDFDGITICYGAHTPADLLYKDELALWDERNDVEYYVTVDKADELWSGNVGVVTKLLTRAAAKSANTIAVTCGPPIMIKFSLLRLIDLGFKDEDIITSLEMRMKCGIGKCGRCNIGHLYVCKDGPVFSCAQLKDVNYAL